MEEKIQILKNQVNFLQERVIDLENQNIERKVGSNILSNAQKQPLETSFQSAE